MSAILLAIIGWDPKGWDQLFRTLAPQHDIRLWPETPRQSGRRHLRLRLEAAARDARRATEAEGGVLARRRRRRPPDRPETAERADRADRRCRPHHADDRICRAACADVSSPAAALRHAAARAHVARPRAAAGERSRGRRSWASASSAARRRSRCSGSAFASRAGAARRRSLPGIETFYGSVGLEPFLRRTEILVCLLPSTPATRGILNLDLFRRLKFNGAMHGAYLINAARGDLQVDADIVAALEDGTLAGATLDVFPIEPLPVTSPLWTHPKVTITPHNAAQPRRRAPSSPTSCARSTGSRSACRSSTWSTAAAATERGRRAAGRCDFAAGGADARHRFRDRLDRDRHVDRRWRG